MGAQGTAVLDFGAFPGTDVTITGFTGQVGILPTSLVEAWIIPEATAVHSEDEVIMLTRFVAVSVPVSMIVADEGAEIYGVIHDGFLWGTLKVGWVWN